MRVFSKGRKIAKVRGETLAKAGRTGLLAAIVGVAILFASVHAPAAQAARGMELGIYDGDFVSGDLGTRTTVLNEAVQARAGWVLLYVAWSAVAPHTLPAGFAPSNPADPNYNFDSIDAAVRDANARGLKVLMAITNAPAWAEGPDRPSEDKAPPGTWKPNPADLGSFVRAIATRYSGNFMGLPAVRYWQLWAEPNLAVNLGPQFEGGQAVGFDIYRPMLNAFYNNLKAVSTRNVAITGGTAPYGNLTPASGLVFQRMQPLQFWRGLLCYQAGANRKKHKRKKGRNAVAARSRGARLIPLPCPDPARFDVAAHHPINVGAPTRSAINADDASTPDLGRIKRILRAAAQTGRVVPGGNKPIWATELWWNSSPPGRGLPLGRQARYLEQGFYVLWKQAVPVVFWFEVRDLVPDPGGLPIPTSGLFFRDGRPKPALQAYRFPFVTERLRGNQVRAWGIAPSPGKVSIEIGRHRFRHLKTLNAGSNRVFVGILHLGGKAKLRAHQGSETSLVWKQN
jgi:hypothetical protein